MTTQVYKNQSVEDYPEYSAYLNKELSDAPSGVAAEVLEAPHARLDTPRLTSHKSTYVVKSDLTSQIFGKKQLHEKQARQERQRHVYNQLLIQRLEEMASSERLEYQQHASKWLDAQTYCPGKSIHCDEHGQEHCPGCTADHYQHDHCRHPLCPHSQAARSANWGKAFSAIWEAGYVKRPVLNTFSPPNIKHLENRSIRDLRRVIAHLLRLSVSEPVEGAITGIEVNYNQDSDWNLHAHQLADSGYVAHYPMTDLAVREIPRGKRSAPLVVAESGNGSSGLIKPFESYRLDKKRSRIQIRKRHAGLAREFTRICNQVDSKTGDLKYKTLARSLDSDFDIDNPNDWYFVDQRRADKGSVIEVTKYITKSSTILSSLDSMMTYIRAIAGNRMLAVHGSFYNHFEIKGREGRVRLVNTCDALVTNVKGVKHKCGVKNDVFASSCKSCGSVLTLSAEMAEALYIPADMQDPDDPAPDYSPLIESVEKVSRRFDCPDPECPNPSGQKTPLETGPPRIVIAGVFRLVTNIETGNSQVVRNDNT